MPIDFPVTGDESKPDSSIKKIQQLALGNPVILASAPTTAAGQLSENTLGFDGTNLFITLQGSTYKITLTLV